MLGFLLILICLISVIILIILSYLYNLVLEEDMIRRKHKYKYIDDYNNNKKLYNYNIFYKKLNLAKYLKDDSLLVGNDTLNEEALYCKKFNLRDDLEYDMENKEDLELKSEEKYFLKKLLKK
jgi:hypothetical protein